MFIHAKRMYIIIKIQKTVSSSQFEFIQKIKSYIGDFHILVVRQRNHMISIDSLVVEQ